MLGSNKHEIEGGCEDDKDQIAIKDQDAAMCQ